MTNQCYYYREGRGPHLISRNPNVVTTTGGERVPPNRKVRESAWNSYRVLIEETNEKIPFDYGPLQEHIIFNGARAEHLALKKMGLSVPEEAQVAIFSVEVAGI